MERLNDRTSVPEEKPIEDVNDRLIAAACFLRGTRGDIYSVEYLESLPSEERLRLLEEVDEQMIAMSRNRDARRAMEDTVIQLPDQRALVSEPIGSISVVPVVDIQPIM